MISSPTSTRLREQRKGREEVAAAVRDHNFSPEQIESYRALFTQYDANGNGDIDANELWLMLQDLELQVTYDEVVEMLKAIDKDGTMSIDWDEFLTLLWNYRSGGDSDDDFDDPASPASGEVALQAALEDNFKAIDLLTPEEMAARLKMLLNMKDMLRDAFDGSVDDEGEGEECDEETPTSEPLPAPPSRKKESGSGVKILPEPPTSTTKKRGGAQQPSIAETPTAAAGGKKQPKPPKMTKREKHVQFVIDGLHENGFSLPATLLDSNQNRTPTPTQASGVPAAGGFTVGKRNEQAEHSARQILNVISKVSEKLENKLSLAVDFIEVGVNGFEEDANDYNSTFITGTGTGTASGGSNGGVNGSRGVGNGGDVDLSDPAQLAVELDELANFTFEEAASSGAAQGADAFKLKAREFPFFMFPIDMVCDQLNLVKERYDMFTHQVGLNEYLLRPRCPDGLNCKLRMKHEHRLKFTHPCYSGQSPCPHANGKMHMKCYTHGDEAQVADKEYALKEFQKMLGVLDLSGFEIGDCGAQCLAFVLKRDLMLPKEQRLFKDIRLSGNHVSPTGAIPIIDYASDLVRLDLSSNGLGYRGSLLMSGGGVGPSLHQLLLRGEKLTHLNLARNRLSDNEMKYIARGLKDNNILKHLDLRKNEFGPACGELLASAMSDNRYLSELFLGWNRLEATGSMELLNELFSSSTVEVLDLSWTGITDEGGKLIAKMIAGSTALLQLDVSHNGIGKQAALLISKAIPQSRTLQHLDLSFNPLGDRGTTEIIRDLRENFTVETLDLRSTKARDEAHKEIQLTLRTREGKMMNGASQNIIFERETLQVE